MPNFWKKSLKDTICLQNNKIFKKHSITRPAANAYSYFKSTVKLVTPTYLNSIFGGIICFCLSRSFVIANVTSPSALPTLSSWAIWPTLVTNVLTKRTNFNAKNEEAIINILRSTFVFSAEQIKLILRCSIRRQISLLNYPTPAAIYTLTVNLSAGDARRGNCLPHIIQYFRWLHYYIYY